MKYSFSIALTLLLFACNNQNQQQASNKDTNASGSLAANTKTFRSDTMRCSFEYPLEWSLNYNNQTGKSASMVEPLTDSTDRFGARFNIWAEYLPVPITDSMYGLAAMSQIKVANNGMTVNNEGKKQFGTNSFRSFSFNFSMEDQSEYAVRGFTLIQDSIGYNISFTAEREQINNYSATIEKMLTSFKTH